MSQNSFSGVLRQKYAEKYKIRRPGSQYGLTKKNALFPTRVDGIAGRGPNVGSVIFLFAGKEVFPLPTPHPFSRKAKYF